MNKPPLTRNLFTVEMECAKRDREAIIHRFGRPAKWESPIRAEQRRQAMARVEAVATECANIDRLPVYSSRVEIDWPLVYRNGVTLRPILPRRVMKR